MTENGCEQCGENTYSGAGASSCTSCPDDMISAAGSTSEADCEYGRFGQRINFKRLSWAKNQFHFDYLKYDTQEGLVAYLIDGKDSGGIKTGYKIVG